MSRHCVTFVAILLVESAVARGDDATKAEPKIEGTWRGSRAELGGKKMPDKVIASLTLTLKGGTYEAVAESADRGTVRYDTSAEPRAMDIKGVEGPNKGKTYLAIYELKHDTLTICYDLSGASRPKEFKTQPGTRLFLVTYARVKKTH
jgi:uncharacterized protein (TIGR03067 family)